MWNWHGTLPSGWGSLGGDWETSSPSGAGGLVPWGMHPLSHISSYMGGSGREGMEFDKYTMPGHCCGDKTCLLDWNATTDSITDNHSTPLGCACPTPTHSPTTSSSCKELASNRVQSPLVIVRTHTWLSRSGLSPRV